LRFGLGRWTTDNEVDTVVGLVTDTITRFQDVSVIG
jgi:cysteine sulfinate desulfinase/cysteine desulfurase-like protein